jgi:PAS domain S-box-containing protein
MIVAQEAQTEQRLAEARSREAAEQYKLMVESVTDYAIFMLDQEGRVQTWNEVCERVTGWKAEEVIGSDCRIFATPEDREAGRPEKQMETALTQGAYRGAEVRVRSDGSRYWARISMTPISKGGKLVGFTKVLQNIDDRRRAELLAQAISDNASTAIFLMCPDGRCAFMNPAAEAMTGFSCAEIKGRPFHDIVHPICSREAGAGPHECEITQAVQGQRTVRDHEDVFVRKDGTFFPVRCAASPIVKDGVLTGIILEARDISDEKNTRAQLEQSNRRKDELLAMLAHELRNPLSPIVTGIQLIQMTRPSQPAVQKSLERMSRQANTLIRLVDDLMDISRISRGRIYLQKEEVSFQHVVEQAVDSVQHHIHKKEQHLHLDVPHSLSLRADLARLQQIIGNLLNNASKYGKHHGNIWLRAYQDGPDAILVVRDDGRGISSTMLDAIFDQFVQENPSAESGGLGIGLTLVRSLVQLHGGKVIARSEGPGKGAEVEVRLPLVPLAARMHAAGEENSGCGRMRILIVDDNVDQADNLAALLELDGYGVDVAYRGEDGIQRIEQDAPDAVLLDIGMPDMSGYEVIARLGRENRPFMVAVTGYGQSSDRQRTRKAGFDEHLVKPVRLERLQEVLSRIRPRG